MLCGLLVMQEASFCDCLSFDPFPFDEDGSAASEVDVGRRQVAEALVVSAVIVVGDEGSDAGFELTGQIIVLEQDAVLQGLVPTLDLALCLRMEWCPADVVDGVSLEPCGEVRRDVTRAVVGQKPGPIGDGSLFEV